MFNFGSMIQQTIDKIARSNKSGPPFFIEVGNNNPECPKGVYVATKIRTESMITSTKEFTNVFYYVFERKKWIPSHDVLLHYNIVPN